MRDEYEYVSDEGELKIDEFPIRRKKNAAKRDLSCEYTAAEPYIAVTIVVSCNKDTFYAQFQL